ncbi:MAG: helix-turn-helix transcriptional regulator [Cyanobacteria bacterium P01_A01_bin.40]
MSSIFGEEYQAFLKFLITARKQAGLTQQTVADSLKRPQSFVSKYENGERRLDVVEYLHISEIIGFDPCQIIRQLQINSSNQYQGKL